ncbi:lipoyl synthase [Anaerosalibacter massiliensis]|uniref:Lipoyl synthase n=1 Tax=Anaerosalibacter massiliensis TaxID=1347392 RepID=A0A9X2MI99_9FIRM|nr:lipoyl synthase [Anaerosalibacter massiliensis]MCR2044164.1 lipoyl synthase [Anaerosalibacter massiliensis]
MESRKPEWLNIKLRGNREINNVNNLVKGLSLNTVCKEANCPNLMECFSKRTATFMILGSNCTRNCTFCNVTTGKPEVVDLEEPLKVANAVKELGLKYVVITSVTRDDLPDGGAEHFAKVIESIKELNESIIVEVLIPDFKGDKTALSKVVESKPEVINHNVETIPKLYSTVRPMAIYERSLKLLENVKSMDKNILTKSGIMVGLGEKEGEVIDLFKDLRKVDCDILTIGQYLAPSKKHHPVVEYIHPDIFENYKNKALKMGFKFVASGPLVRSSYHADQVIDLIK